MNKLKKTILALTFLGRVKKDQTPSSPKDLNIGDDYNNEDRNSKYKNYNQILSTCEENTTALRTVSLEEKQEKFIKNNKIVPIPEFTKERNENIDEDQTLQLEKFEKEVNLTENDSRYFKSESELDESPLFENRINDSPSLFLIEEEDEGLYNKQEEKKDIFVEAKSADSRSPKIEQPKHLKKPTLPNEDNEKEKEKLNESVISKKFNEENEWKGLDISQEDIVEISSKGTTTRLRSEERFKNKQWLIYPDDKFKKIWNLVMGLLIIYVSIVLPFRVCFMEDDSEFQNLDYFTDSCFYLDMIVNFFSVYYDANDDLIVSHKKIVMKYLTGWFILDFIAIFPFDAIILDSKYNSLIRVARLPKLYRLVRITKLIRMLKIFKEKKKILNPLFKMGAGSQRLLFSIISIIVFCHIACCFWYLTAILNDSNENWVDENGYTDSTNLESYIVSFYWVTSTVVTVGYGDIVAVNTTERIMSCLLMFVGVVFYSFTIGSLSSLLSEFDAKNSIFDQKINTLLQIKRKYSFDDNLYLRIKKALKYGHLKIDQDKEKFLIELPSNIRTELSYFMHKSLVNSIEFFKNRSERFIAYIGPLLKPIKFGKNEVIASQGDYANEMFFIKKGKVAIAIRQYNNFKFMSISEGYYFGEVDLLFGETRKFTFISETDLELLSINKKQFSKIFFHEFISIGSELYKNALKRRVRSNKLFREALDYCQKRSKQEKSRKISKGNQESFVINEEKYSRKISCSRDDLSCFEREESIKENYNIPNKQIFENVDEEQYIKSFKNMSKNSWIAKEKSRNSKKEANLNEITEFTNESGASSDKNLLSSKVSTGNGRLKNIISNLIQSKKTLKDEVNDIMTNNTLKKQRSEDLQTPLININKKASFLHENLYKFLLKIRSFQDKISESNLEKIQILLNEEKIHKKTTFTVCEPKKMSRDASFGEFSLLKKTASIKLSNPITTLEKILEIDKTIISSRKSQRRKSVTPDTIFKKSMTKLPGHIKSEKTSAENFNSYDSFQGKNRTRVRSKSIKK